VTDYSISTVARQDMLDIFSYIEEHNLTAAFRLHGRFLTAFQNLAKRPKIGHWSDWSEMTKSRAQ
jgi:plasmid stabilization system protein ParE